MSARCCLRCYRQPIAVPQFEHVFLIRFEVIGAAVLPALFDRNGFDIDSIAALLAAGDDRGFDRASFAASFAVLGAQRATKILGIFSRLSMRDGKHGYLAHIPRVSRYLEMNLEHGALAPLRAWFDRHLPRAKRDAHR